MSVVEFELTPTTIGYEVISAGFLGQTGPEGPRGTSATPGTEITDPIIEPDGSVSYTITTYWGIDADGNAYQVDDPALIPPEEKAWWNPATNEVELGAPGITAAENEGTLELSTATPQPNTLGPGSAGPGDKASPHTHTHQQIAHASTHGPGGSDELTLDLLGAAPADGPFAPSIPGAVTPVRFVGGVNGSPPVSGVWQSGDFVVDRTGGFYIQLVDGGNVWTRIARASNNASLALAAIAASGGGVESARWDHVHPTTGLELTANRNVPGGYALVGDYAEYRGYQGVGSVNLNGSLAPSSAWRTDFPGITQTTTTAISTRHLVWQYKNLVGDDPMGPIEGETFYAATNFQPKFFIDRSFSRFREITSVSWYFDDSNLIAGSTTPSGAPVSTQTTAPFSAGGANSNQEMNEVTLTGLSSGSKHTVSVLVTYAGGGKETASASFYPFTSKASFATYRAAASGSTTTVPRGVYDANFTDSTSRGSMATLKAQGRVLLIATLGGGPSTTAAMRFTTTASKLTFQADKDGSFGILGMFMNSGADIVLDDSGSSMRPYIDYPYWLAPGDETWSRCLYLDSNSGAAGVRCMRPVVRGWRVGGTSLSDMAWIARAEDVLLERCRFEKNWDRFGAAHFDGMQVDGGISASGNLEGRARDDSGNLLVAGILVRNCDFLGSWIIKPNQDATHGQSARFIAEDTTVHDSCREGIAVFTAGTNGSLVWSEVVFDNVWTWGHASTDYNPNTGTTIKTYGQGIIFNNPSASEKMQIPASHLDRPLESLIPDSKQGSFVTTTSVSITRPGISGPGSYYTVFIGVTDPNVTVVAPNNNWTSLGSQVAGNSKLWAFGIPYMSGQLGPWSFTFIDGSNVAITASGSYITIATLHANKTKPVEAIAFQANAGSSGSITAPSVATIGRNRQAARVWFMGGTSTTGTWTRPTHLSSIANTLPTQATNSVAAIQLGYYPFSSDVPVGDLGSLACSLSTGGDGVGATVVFAPAKEPPIVDRRYPNLSANSIPAVVTGRSNRTVETLLQELSDAVAAGITGISSTIMDAKGDSIWGSANDTVVRVPAGADGTTLVFDSTATAGVTAKPATSSLYVVTAEQTLQNTTTETVVLGPYTIPANSVKAGQTYRLIMWGKHQNAGSTTPSSGINYRIRVGGTSGTSLATFGWSTATVKSTDQGFFMTAFVTFRAAYSSTTATIAGGTLYQAATNASTAPATSASNVNMTADKDLVITAAWTVADAANILNVEGGVIELVN